MSGRHGGLRGVEAVAAGDSFVHRLDPRAKIVGLIGLVVVSVGTPPGAWAAFAAYLLALAVLVAAARLPVAHVAGRMVVEVPFLVAAVVLWIVDGPVAGATLAARITVGVLAMVVLSSTTPFPRLLDGFERLRAPRLLLVIVAFMWRYLHLLADEIRRMRVAQLARGHQARTLLHAGTALGPAIASLFIRSLERGERVHLAMRSRGWNGLAPGALAVGAEAGLRRADVAFLLTLAVLLASVRLSVMEA